MRSPHAARCPFEITAQRLCSDQQSVAICYFSFLDQAGLILSRFGADTDRLLATRSLSRPRLIGSHVSMISAFDGVSCALFEGRIGVDRSPTRPSVPPCSRPSRTLRAADAVGPDDGPILDRRCARRHWLCAGRDGRMVPIEQKDAGRQQSGAELLGEFLLPLPACGTRKWEVRAST
jgi:hypothetical protein